MNKDLTSHPATEKLTEVTVMGRAVYVSESTEEAYVEFQDELVSMTNLNAWNYLMEQGKQEVIDGYEREQTLAEKQVDETTNRVASEIEDTAHELMQLAGKVSRAGDTDE